MVPLERSFSKLSENQKNIVEIGSRIQVMTTERVPTRTVGECINVQVSQNFVEYMY